MTLMYTVCPKCALTLAVTAGDLRVAQGHVRCGRCQHVFNALTRLTSEDRQGGMADPEATAIQAAPGFGAIDEEPIPEDAFEFNADASKVFVEALPAPRWTPTGTYRGAGVRDDVPADGTMEIEPLEFDLGDSTLETPILRAPPEPPSPRRTPRGPQSVPRQPAMIPDEDDQEPVPVSSEVWTPRRTRYPDPELPLPSTLLQLDQTPANESPRARPDPIIMAADPHAAAHAILRPARSPRRTLWLVGSGVLALLLAVQVIHHARNDLATVRQLRVPLTRLYGMIGIPLVPRWDLTAYDVRALGASASSARAGQITVRASIGLKKSASQAQPLPLLRVTLQDRLGNPTGSRDVLPAAYLPSARHSGAFLTAGERIDAQIAFIDPGSNAMGFEIDACLPAPEGGTACANDAARH
jgi:predicted Zn finger-like uncharacterized protein